MLSGEVHTHASGLVTRRLESERKEDMMKTKEDQETNPAKEYRKALTGVIPLSKCAHRYIRYVSKVESDKAQGEGKSTGTTKQQETTTTSQGTGNTRDDPYIISVAADKLPDHVIDLLAGSIRPDETPNAAERTFERVAQELFLHQANIIRLAAGGEMRNRKAHGINAMKTAELNYHVEILHILTLFKEQLKLAISALKIVAPEKHCDSTPAKQDNFTNEAAILKDASLKKTEHREIDDVVADTWTGLRKFITDARTYFKLPYSEELALDDMKKVSWKKLEVLQTHIDEAWLDVHQCLEKLSGGGETLNKIKEVSKNNQISTDEKIDNVIETFLENANTSYRPPDM